MAEPATEAGSSDSLEGQIEQWRSYLRRRQAIRPVDVEELEDHLRGEVAALRGAGLSENEAFLVAVKRMGALDAISNEFAREHSERLWKQLVIVVHRYGPAGGRGADRDDRRLRARRGSPALAVKVPELFGLEWGGGGRCRSTCGTSASSSFPFLTGYFVWKRRLEHAHLGVAGAGVRGRGRLRQRLSLRGRRRHGERSPRCTCRSRCGCPWGSPTRGAAGGRAPGAWTSSASPASCSSTTR